MKSCILVIVLCFAAISLFSQPKDSPAKNETSATQSSPTPAPSNSEHKPADDRETTKSGPPHWYTSSEWWLVLIAALTGAAIAYQAREMAKTTEVIEGQLTATHNAERAWIQVPEIIKQAGLSVMPLGPEQFFIRVLPYIKNTGRTHARITRIAVRKHVVDAIEKTVYPVTGRDWPVVPRLPEKPELLPEHTLQERDVVLSPDKGINWVKVSIARDDLERIKTRDAFLYVYGRIDYVDISSKPKHTCFCRLYWIPYGPDDPVHVEDFVESAMIPPAYTEST